MNFIIINTLFLFCVCRWKKYDEFFGNVNKIVFSVDYGKIFIHFIFRESCEIILYTCDHLTLIQCLLSTRNNNKLISLRSFIRGT